jgi:hypothetical protein
MFQFEQSYGAVRFAPDGSRHPAAHFRTGNINKEMHALNGNGKFSKTIVAITKLALYPIPVKKLLFALCATWASLVYVERDHWRSEQRYLRMKIAQLLVTYRAFREAAPVEEIDEDAPEVLPIVEVYRAFGDAAPAVVINEVAVAVLPMLEVEEKQPQAELPDELGGALCGRCRDVHCQCPLLDCCGRTICVCPAGRNLPIDVHDRIRRQRARAVDRHIRRELQHHRANAELKEEPEVEAEYMFDFWGWQMARN